MAGVGLAVFLYFLEAEDPIYLVGLISLLIGLVMTVFGFAVKGARPEAG